MTLRLSRNLALQGGKRSVRSESTLSKPRLFPMGNVLAAGTSDRAKASVGVGRGALNGLTPFKKQALGALLVVFVLTQSGCAILKVPFTLVGGVFKLVGKVLQVVDKLPKPPPGVF